MPKVVDALVSHISKGDSEGIGVAAMHLNLGVVGTTFIFDALTDLGLDDLALQVLLQDTYPSFGYMIANSATTVWEVWEGYNATQHTSLNHATLGGGLASWMYSAVVGLDTETNGTCSGWQHVLIRPVHAAVHKLGYARGSVNTRFGNTTVSWRTISGQSEAHAFVLEATLPPGSTASLSIPLLGASPADVTISEHGADIWKNNEFVPGVLGIDGAVITTRGSKAAITFALRSGSYTFKSEEAAEIFI